MSTQFCLTWGSVDVRIYGIQHERKQNVKRLTSTLILLVAAIIWGFAFSAQKASDEIPALTLNAIRSIVASVFLFLIIPIFDKLGHTGRHLFSKKRPIDFTRTELIGGAVIGLILAVATFFQQSGMSAGADAGKVSFITAIYVVLVPVYSLFIGKRAHINVWISVIIAAVGFYFLCINGEFKLEASDLIAFCCSFIFPLHILFVDKFSPICDGVRMSCIQFLCCGIFSTVAALIFDPPTPVSTVLDNALPILFLGIMSSGIAYTLQIIGQRGANPTVAAVILSLESVFGVLGAALLLGETMSTREYVGSAIVFVAVILSQLDFSAIFTKKDNNTLQNCDE